MSHDKNGKVLGDTGYYFDGSKERGAISRALGSVFLSIDRASYRIDL
jgi:hypothetical protein